MTFSGALKQWNFESSEISFVVAARPSESKSFSDVIDGFSLWKIDTILEIGLANQRAGYCVWVTVRGKKVSFISRDYPEKNFDEEADFGG